jgi:hypothetical protein
MPINKTCNFINRDLYFYDFKSAYPRIMGGIDWDFSSVDLNDKEGRNIQIGLSQRDNENLSSYLINTVTSMVDYYIKRNGLKEEEDVIVTQRDGLITKKSLLITDELMKLDFRGMIQLLVITTDRKKYLSVRDDNKVEVKGVQNVYDELFIIYNRFSNLNFFDKKVLFSQLHAIRKAVFKIEDKKFFMIPFNEEIVVQSLNGPRVVSGELAFSIKDIDKLKYYNHYFREFVESVFLETY